MAAMAHRDHGKLPWAKLFEPAIRLAREGLRINHRLYNSLSAQPGHAAFSAAARQLYFDAEGQVLPPASLVRNERLAQTFALSIKAGADVVYGSERGRGT